MEEGQKAAEERPETAPADSGGAGPANDQSTQTVRGKGAGGPRTRRKAAREYAEILQVSLIYFSVVSLATLEFLKNAFPRRDIILPDKVGVIWAVIILQVIPVAVLIGADRLIALRDPSGKWNGWFRTAVFSVSLILIIRQLEIYSDTGNELANELRSVGEWFVWVCALGITAGVVALCVIARRGVTTFFYYVSPIAIAASAVIPYQAYTSAKLAEGYGQEVTTVAEADERSPVFVFVFDEMDAEQMMAEDGLIDSVRYPNMAGLAADGAWFTNATSNYFWSFESIPSISLPITKLHEEYNVRMYSQFLSVEDKYDEGCGEKWTCRGVTYLTDRRKGFLALNVGLRMFYNIMPETVEEVTEAPMGLVVNDMLGVSYPNRDEPGFHIFTKEQFDTFMGDVSSEESRGSAYFVHILLPHHPHVFEPGGSASPDPLAKSNYEAQGIQAEFVDKLLGEFIEKLKNEEIYEESTVVVTSDHGYRGAFPRGEYQLAHHTTHVPLIIRGPGVPIMVSDVDYQHVDFEATLTDVLDLPAPAGDGVSAFAEQRPQRDKIFRVNDLVFRYVAETGEWERVQAPVAAGGGTDQPAVQE